MPLRNQLVIAAEHFAREEKMSPVLMPTLSKDMDEQLNVADVVDRREGKFCKTLLRYGEEETPGSSFAQVGLFTRKREDEKFHQIVYVKHKLEEFMYLI